MIAATCLSVNGAAAAASPSALVSHLLTAPPTAAPLWFGAAQPKTSSLSERALKYRALARIVVDSGLTSAEAAWLVFPSPESARADLNDAIASLRRHGLAHAQVLKLQGFPQPAYIVSGRFRATNRGITYALFLNGITFADAFTLGTKGGFHGDLAKTVELARWAQQRLAAAKR